MTTIKEQIYKSLTDKLNKDALNEAPKGDISSEHIKKLKLLFKLNKKEIWNYLQKKEK